MNTSASGSAARYEVMLGRQPIFDRARTIHAFELLFRHHAVSVSSIDGNSATAHVVLNALVEIGVNNLSSGELLFVNCTREILFAQPIIPPERAVLEILETIELDDALVGRMRELRQSGYRLALDDFVWSEQSAAAVAEADYVKLDIRNLTESQLREHCHILSRYPARIIAEKVESEQELQLCQNIGIDLFQGYYLRKPDVVRRRTMPTSRLAALRIVSQCQNPNITVPKLAETISSDLSLAWSLLRLTNTLLYSGAAPVETLTQAVARLGTQKLMRWAVLLTLAGQPDCPCGYIQLSLQRAYMCEKLATDLHIEAPDAAFLVGLLSLLDSIVDMPMSALMRELPLAPRIRAALVDREGPAGTILEAVLAWDRGEWQNFTGFDIPHAVAMDAWLHSLKASAETLHSLTDVQRADSGTSSARLR